MSSKPEPNSENDGRYNWSSPEEVEVEEGDGKVLFNFDEEEEKKKGPRK